MEKREERNKGITKNREEKGCRQINDFCANCTCAQQLGEGVGGWGGLWSGKREKIKKIKILEYETKTRGRLFFFLFLTRQMIGF